MDMYIYTYIYVQLTEKISIAIYIYIHKTKHIWKKINIMDAKMGDAAAQKNGYEPTSDLIQEQDCDTLLIYLPGFKKEQLRVQLARSGTLRISGTRPIGDNKLSSFQKDYPVSPNCDTSNITAKFEGGILYVRQPKLIVPAEKDDEKQSPVLETPPTPRSVDQRPPTPIPSRPKKDQENNNSKKTSVSEAQIKQESAADFHDKSAQKEDTKPVELEKVSESKDDKNEKTGTIDDDQRAKPRITDQHEEFSGNDDSEFANKKTENLGKYGVDYYKLGASSAAAKLMKSGKMICMVMAIILAFAFGMYVNNLIWGSNKPEN